MGISYELYNAPSEWAMMNTWDQDYSQPIDTSENVMARIMALYPRVTNWNFSEWPKVKGRETPFTGSYLSVAKDNCNPNNEYIEISLTEHKDGYIHWIRVDRGSPKLIRELLEEFNIKYVFEAQSCRLLDPYLYKDNWVPIEE